MSELSYVIVDIEADGPCPGLYSMISIGAVLFEDFDRTFYANVQPLEGANYDPSALSVSGFTRLDTMFFDSPHRVMQRFSAWLLDAVGDQPIIFVSDNAGFDWQFVNYYFHRFVGMNPFGHSPASITWLYKGFARDARASFRDLRQTPHTHHALHDAIGNAEALRAIREKGMKL